MMNLSPTIFARRVLTSSAGLLFLVAQLKAIPFSPNQIEVPGAINQGLDLGSAVWGDYDNDGDLDILTCGRDAANARQIRIYQNNAGAFALVNVAGAGAGLQDSSVAFGDVDGDGDLDIITAGVDSGGTRRIRQYRNDGSPWTTFTLLADIDALGAGTNRSDVALGDFDGDGDLDILFSGRDTGGRRLRVYRNNGNGTFDPNQIELAGGVELGDVAWGDYDNDGDLDILFSGLTAGGAANRVLKIYPNNGDGTFGASFNVLNAATGFSVGDIRWGDFDNDGDLDILAGGSDQAGARQIRAYRNTAGVFAQIEIPGGGLGYSNSSFVFGDVNNDGTLDVATLGTTGASREVRVSTFNAGTNAFTAPLYNVESAGNLGLQDGGIALGDYDGDGDADILASGSSSTGRQVRLYLSSASLTNANTAPLAPTTLAGRFQFARTGVSVASFTWNTGTDAGALATRTPANGLYYDVQISTLNTFAKFAAPSLMGTQPQGTTPQQGGYLRPPSIFGGATPIGIMLKSTQPWAGNNAHPGLITDTTYYFRVVTIDAGLLSSGFSAAGTLWTGVAPTTSTLTAVTGISPGDINVSWKAPGDDAVYNNLNGNFRIQYSSNVATVWSTNTTPSGAYTVTIATTNVTPGTTQSRVLNVPTNDTYYIVLWSQDDVGEWSLLSNTANAVPAVITRSVSISGSPYNFGSQNLGVSTVTATVLTVTNDGNVAETFSFSAATSTAGSPWSMKATPPAGSDQAVAYAAFHPTRPASGTFGAEDVSGPVSLPSTATAYTIDGSETGVSVGVGQTRNLWIRLDLPTTSATAIPQTLTVTITAGP